jgi:hypothetical protein
MKQKTIFYEGQQVGCLMYGEGVVRRVVEESTYPVRVDFLEIKYESYTKDGKRLDVNNATLYPLAQYREIIKNIPLPEPEAWQPKEGELCWFWDEYSTACILGKYSAMSGSLFTAKGYSNWQNCAPYIPGELPPNMKEVQP